MKRVYLIFSLLMLSLFSLSAQNISKQTAQKKKIEEEIALIDVQLNTTQNQKHDNLQALALTQTKIEARRNLIEQIDKEIEGYNKSIAIKNQQIARLSARLDTLKYYYDKLILNSYKNRDSKVWFMYIMASDNLGQGLRRWSYLRNLSHSVQVQAMNIREVQLDLALENENLRKLKLESLSTKKQREKEYEELSNEEVAVTNTISRLSKQEKQMRSQLEKKKKEMERLNKEIEKILADAVREQKRAGEKIAIDYELSAKFSDNKGKLPWPVKNGVIVEKFGQAYHPVFRNVKLPFNNGVNFSTTVGENAYCIFDGVVKQVLVMPGYNQCVLVQHGEYFTFYCKLKRVFVSAGDKLATGQEIGSIATSDDGNAVFHFQLWKGTEKQNPEHWLRK